MVRTVLTLSLLAGFAGSAFAQTPNQFEPNQTRRTAARIELGDYKGLHCDGEDWYFLDVPGDQRLELSVRFQHAQGDLDLEVVDPRGRTLGWSRGTGDEEVLGLTLGREGAVFVRVHNAATDYDLHLGTSAGRFDGNGSTEAITCWGDDWFPLPLGDGEELRASIEFDHELGDLDLALFDTEGQELVRSNSQENTEEVRYLSQGGEGMVLLRVYHVHRSRNDYRLSLGSGSATLQDVADAFRVARLDGAGRDLIYLRQGDTLEGRILTPEIQLAASYGDVTLPTSRVAGLDLERRRTEVESLATVDGDHLSGFLRTSGFEVELPGFSDPVWIARERITKVVFGKRGNERQGLERHVQVVLSNGDHFFGELLNAPKWTVGLGFADLELEESRLQALHLEGEGQVQAVLRNQSIWHGRMRVPVLFVDLDVVPGVQRLRIHPHTLNALYFQTDDLTGGAGALGRAQLRRMVLQIWEDAPDALVDDVLAGENLVMRYRELSQRAPLGQEGNRLLERHILYTEDAMERYALFEVLLRVSQGARDRAVAVIGNDTEGREVRIGACLALTGLASRGVFEPVDDVMANSSDQGAGLMFQVVMNSSDHNLLNRVMNNMRPQMMNQPVMMHEMGDAAHRALGEAIERVLEE